MSDIQNNESNGMAMAAMIVGIIGMILAFIPFIGFLSWILCPLAIILGIIAMKKVVGKGMAIAGIATGAIGLVICILWVVGIASVASNPELQDAIEKAQAEAERNNQ